MSPDPYKKNKKAWTVGLKRVVTILDGAHSIKIKIKIEPLGQDSGFTIGMITYIKIKY